MKLIPPKAAVIGTGRCGTGYTAAVLNNLGYKAGHESYWNPNSPVALDLEVDCSWLATPSLTEKTQAVTQVRHPMAVINSLVGIEFFTNSEHGTYRQFALDHGPFLTGTSNVVDAMRWYLHWNQACEKVSRFTYRIEDMDARLLERICSELLLDPPKRNMERHYALQKAPVAYNHRPRAELTWAGLPSDTGTKDDLAAYAAELGYDPEKDPYT